MASHQAEAAGVPPQLASSVSSRLPLLTSFLSVQAQGVQHLYHRSLVGLYLCQLVIVPTNRVKQR